MGSGASVIVSSQVVGNVVLIIIVFITIFFIVFSKSLTISIITMSNYHRIHPPVHHIHHYRRHLGADGNCPKNGGSCSGKQGHARDSQSGEYLGKPRRKHNHINDIKAKGSGPLAKLAIFIR